MIGAADSLIPALDALGAFLFRDVRAEHTVHRPVAGDVLGRLPVAYGEAGQIGRAQRRRFHAAGTLDFEVADVGHGLHEVVVGRRAAVHPERLHGDAGVRRHGAEDVVDLIADAVQRGADDVVLVAAPGEAHDGAAGVQVPVGRAESGEGRHDIAAVGVLHLLGHILGVAGLFQQAQLIAEPLDGRTGHENRAFQRIIHPAVGAAGDGGDKAVPGCDRRLTGIHEQKAAGAEGGFRLAGGKAGTRLAVGFLIGITIVAFIVLRLLAFINRKRNQNSSNVQEKKETSLSKAEWTKIYNAQNIVETEQLVEMLKQNGIAAFSQEAGANVAMHGAPGFGIYGVDIFVKTDDAEKAVQLIKEINNQE